MSKKIVSLVSFLLLLLVIGISSTFGELIGSKISNKIGLTGNENPDAEVISSTGLTMAHQTSFVEGCTKEGSEGQYCQCLFDEIKEQFSSEDLVNLSNSAKSVEDLPDNMKRAIVTCSENKKR